MEHEPIFPVPKSGEDIYEMESPLPIVLLGEILRDREPAGRSLEPLNMIVLINTLSINEK
jgi:hypothetical protein